MKRLSVTLVLFIIHHSSFIIPASAGCGACATATVAAPAATNFVVTQFAVPVAVPQYVVPIAPQSFVQYGGFGASAYSSGGQMPAPAGRQPTSSNETLEDRIAAKIVARLTSSGVLSPEAVPSLVSRTCAGCHSGAQPKGGLDLSDVRKLAAEVRLKCVGRVLTDDPNQRMPPTSSGKNLNADELGRLLQELSAAGQATVPPPAPAEKAN